MAAPEPKAPVQVPPGTLTTLARDILQVPLPEQDRGAVANLLGSLLTDMRAFRAAKVGEVEPAFVYDAAEAQS